MSAVLDEILRLSEPYEWGQLQGAGRGSCLELPQMVHSLITRSNQREASAIAERIEHQCLTNGFGVTDVCAPVTHLLAGTLELATAESLEGVFDLLVLFLGQDRRPRVGTLDSSAYEALVPWFDSFERLTEVVPPHEHAASCFELMIRCAEFEIGLQPRVQLAHDRLLEAISGDREFDRNWVAASWENSSPLPRF